MLQCWLIGALNLKQSTSHPACLHFVGSALVNADKAANLPLQDVPLAGGPCALPSEGAWGSAPKGVLMAALTGCAPSTPTCPRHSHDGGDVYPKLLCQPCWGPAPICFSTFTLWLYSLFDIDSSSFAYKGVMEKELWSETRTLGSCPFKCFPSISLSLVLESSVSHVTATHFSRPVLKLNARNRSRPFGTQWAWGKEMHPSGCFKTATIRTRFLLLRSWSIM